VVRKHPQRTVVALGPSAICDVARTHDLGSQLIGLLDTDRPSLLVVDLGQVGQISSECLNQLINVNCYARSTGVKLVLANLCQPLREVFRITRLDRLFEIADSE
jgi:anti-anti-sigma factor